MILVVYSFLCFIVPCIIWQLLNKKKMQGKENRIRHIVWTYIFMLYCYLAVQDAAGIGTIWDFISYGKLEGNINLIPFQSWGAMTYILNIFMFMPLGFLLPLIWEDFRKIWKVAAVGLTFSFAIEICQLFCYRATDVDDLLMNTIGTVVGYVIWVLFHKIFSNSGKKAIMIGKIEPIVYMWLGVAGIFFLYNWRVFYG